MWGGGAGAGFFALRDGFQEGGGRARREWFGGLGYCCCGEGGAGGVAAVREEDLVVVVRVGGGVWWGGCWAWCRRGGMSWSRSCGGGEFGGGIAAHSGGDGCVDWVSERGGVSILEAQGESACCDLGGDGLIKGGEVGLRGGLEGWHDGRAGE